MVTGFWREKAIPNIIALVKESLEKAFLASKMCWVGAKWKPPGVVPCIDAGKYGG